MLNEAEDIFDLIFLNSRRKKYAEKCIAFNRKWYSLGQKSNHEHRCKESLK